MGHRVVQLEVGGALRLRLEVEGGYHILDCGSQISWAIADGLIGQRGKQAIRRKGMAN